MASTLRGALKAATSRRPSADDPEAAAPEAEKYRLVVTGGPSYDKTQHKVIPVNTGESITVENAFLTAKIAVRIRNYRGLPSRCPPTSPYFADPWHAKDQYSVAFSFVPKQDLPSLNTVWGNDFDHPVRDRLPPGFNLAFKIVKDFIDPGLSCDAYADEPWLYGPSLSCWFAFRVGEKVGEGEDFPAPGEEEVTREGGDGSGADERARLSLPENNEKRRKFFLEAANREAFTFEKGRCYTADFFNPYLDFGNCALKLPGFSLNVIRYVDNKSHCLRYVFKNRETGDVYVNVNIALLWEEDLRAAERAEKEGDEALQAAIGGEVVRGEETGPARDSPEVDGVGNGQGGDVVNDNGPADGATGDGKDSPDSESRSEAKESQTADVSQNHEIRQHLEGTASADKRGSSAGIL